jgi:diaminopimelate epimerase
MIIHFSKYQGAGNDFIIINMMETEFELSTEQIAKLCDRRFGIGADGLMTISKDAQSDFYMRYYNSDGYEGSMCGNGGRCIAKYAYTNKICGESTQFNAIDGNHNAVVIDEKVSLSMHDVSDIKEYEDGYFLNTGSPHFVKFVDSISEINVKDEGLKIANEPRFAPARTNVNFIDFNDGKWHIATFERGVEDETLACGTGSVAAAIVIHFTKKSAFDKIKLIAKGGILEVFFKNKGTKYSDVILSGPAVHVFNGIVEI